MRNCLYKEQEEEEEELNHTVSTSLNSSTLTVYVSTVSPLLNTQELYIHQTHGGEGALISK